ncbi:MAG: site-specific integrase, partial [Saprospiraceae bacterium]|nr:site-specific integrase [Saprospiraceae bacterium]
MFHETSFFSWLSHEKRFAANTLEAYRGDLEGFIAHLTEQQCLASIEEVRHFHIRSWIVSMMEAGQSPRSINRRLSCLKTYFRFLKKRKLLLKDPMTKVIAPRTGKKLPVFMQESQMEALFSNTVFGDDFVSRQEQLILELLYATGIRRSEASLLRVNDVDFGRMTLRISGKGDKVRIIPFAGYLSSLLQQFITLR